METYYLILLQNIERCLKFDQRALREKLCQQNGP